LKLIAHSSHNSSNTMKKALQILYGTDDSNGNEDSQESQYLLHSTFCSQYAVTSDYSSLNYLGTNPLGSLAMICFPSKSTYVEMSKGFSLPDRCFQQVLSFLSFGDQINARTAFKFHRNQFSNGSNGNSNEDDKPGGGYSGGYIIDPLKLKADILAPRKIPTPQVIQYVNMEVDSDEESQNVDIIIEEPSYLDLVNIGPGSGVILKYSMIVGCIAAVVIVVMYFALF
jgi:hypothetical protein